MTVMLPTVSRVGARFYAQRPFVQGEVDVEIEGAVAVVTGAASGIGKATAVGLARAGADVVVSDIDEAGGSATAREIEDLGSRAVFVRTDITSRGDVQALVDRSIAWQGHCDIFMSNVGVGCVGPPQDFTHDEWDYLLAVNLWSCIWPIRTIVPHMVDRGSGRLVFVSSGAGIEGQADRAPYNVAKFGIVGLAESLARYLKDKGVGVTLVIPGAVATDGWKLYRIAGAESLGDAEVSRMRDEQREHSKDWPRPETMAEAIVDGVRNDRYAVIQHNPWQEDWFEDVFVRKGRDPDAFVLGG
jgi:NAD(P)-dependent dehydrogenase (short-subunit alcohol dehydrogenase family)